MLTSDSTALLVHQICPSLHGLADPGNHLVEHLVERRRGLEAQEPGGLAHVRRAVLNVVRIGRIVNHPQRRVAADALPNQRGQFAHAGGRRRGDVEIFVQRRRVFHADADAAGQIAAIGVMAHLVALAQDVQRVLTAEDLLHQVGHDVAHRQGDVARGNRLGPQRPLLADAHAVEGPDDRKGQLVLLPGAAGRNTRRPASESRRCSTAAGTWPGAPRAWETAWRSRRPCCCSRP